MQRYIALCIFLAFLSACGVTSNASEQQPATVVSTTPTAAALPTVAPTSMPQATSPATTKATEPAQPTSAATSLAISVSQVLEAKWYQDGDNNIVPDFLEQELGYDPQADDAAPDACGPAQEGSDYFTNQRNMLVILDSSGSMANGKLDIAKQSINTYVRVACVVDQVGFLVYGHKGDNTEAGKAESCQGIDLLAPIGDVTAENFGSVLEQFQPTGWTPIAGALTKAGEAFTGKNGQINRILLVSDGIETCGGDPVAVAQQLHSQGLQVEINVVGFDIQNQAEAAQLQQIAEVTGGTYYDARTAAELQAYLDQQTQALGQNWEAMVCQINNGFFNTLTDTTLVNRATQRIRELQYRETDQAKEQAYSDLITRITDSLDARNQARQEAVEQAEALRAKYNELREQLNSAVSS